MTANAFTPSPSPEKRCVCGNAVLQEFSPEYLHCQRCETLIARREFDRSISLVADDESDLYGRDYWYSHQQELGFPDIEIRAQQDLPERCVHWLATLLRYRVPPGTFLELGCAHGGFVALARWAGFDAVGLELSPQIADFAAKMFGISVLTGPLEQQQLPSAAYDVIALMDVLEHLPDPQMTMRSCLDLLRDDGVLILQTPRYPEGKTFSAMLAEKHPFLEQLKGKEHLYLFSASSLERMFANLGFGELRHEEPMFPHYDQFVVVGKSILKNQSGSLQSVNAVPGQRLVQGLLDARVAYKEMRQKWQDSEIDRKARLAVINDLDAKLQTSEADRKARLAVINDLDAKLQTSEADREARLAVINDLDAKLQTSEADREARLAVINDLDAKLQTSEADREARLAVINDLDAKLQTSEADREARLAVINDLDAKLQTSEADREARLVVINDLAAKLQASETDREARLAVINDLDAKLQTSEADRKARLVVINDLAAKLQASDADREARLAVINDLAAKLQASEADREARLAVINDLAAKLQASEADREACLAVIKDLETKLQASEADREARLVVINDLAAKLQVGEADREARLAVINDLAAKLQASEADRQACLAVIKDLETKLQASEADREARLVVINDLAAKLQVGEADSVSRLRTIHELERRLAGAEQDALLYKQTLDQWASRRWNRLLRFAGVQFAIPPGRRLPERPWLLQPRPLKHYSLPDFQSEFVHSRPDLNDVRNYNRQMMDIFFGLHALKGETLLDIGASPHGFAMERALELGVREYCGIGLGIAADTIVCDGHQTGVLLNMNAEHLEIASGSFDAIISLSTFEHFFHPDSVLIEMHRVLKPGGIALISFQPVWTSLRGHHLHHIPDVCDLLPAWSHLQWTRSEMMENLRTTWPSTASMPLEEVIRWIYDSDEINRIRASTLRRVLESSPLSVEWITPLADELSEADLIEAYRLAASQPYTVEELTIKGFSAFLMKRA